MMKLATTLQTMTTPDYKDWPTARHALKLAAPNGYRAVGLGGEGGILAEGALADVTLWDLSSLALLPRTDPLTLLVLGSRTQAPSAGAALSDSWCVACASFRAATRLGLTSSCCAKRWRAPSRRTRIRTPPILRPIQSPRWRRWSTGRRWDSMASALQTECRRTWRVMKPAVSSTMRSCAESSHRPRALGTLGPDNLGPDTRRV